MDFRNSPYLLDLYLQAAELPEMVVEKSVQSGISELLIILAHIEAARGLRIMYVLPAYEMRDRFVSNRISRLHANVEFYKKLVAEAKGVHRKSFMNIATGAIAFIGSNVENEFLEMPVDSVYVDELDRCNQENLLKIPDRLSASPYRHLRQVSNPTIDGYGIDALYGESSQGHWMLKCEGCGQWFEPDFFRHVVMQHDEERWELRGAGTASGEDARLIHDCGAAVDRLATGEWVHAWPERDVKGFRISKLFVRHASLRELHSKWQKASGSELRKRIFFNSDLGLPHVQEGSRITREDLRRCEAPFPLRSANGSATRFIGVDVGAQLHVVCRETVVYDGKQVLRLVTAQGVDSFPRLIELLEELHPRIVAIDAQPEIHRVTELKERYRNVYSVRFQQNLEKPVIGKTDHAVSVDRTAALDAVRDAVEQRRVEFPVDAERIDGGDYYRQLEASSRVLDWDGDETSKSRYTWINSRPNHYMLAEAYCLLASEISRGTGILDFYGHENDPLNVAIRGGQLSERDIDRLKRISPEAFIGRVLRGNGRV